MKFKIYQSVLYLLILSLRVGLRLVYGKARRDELIHSGRFRIYRAIEKSRKNHLWNHIWAAGKINAWEPKVSKLLAGMKGELFVDVGASIGYYTLLLAGNFEKVVAVEPEAESMGGLRKNTRHLDNVETVQAAISDVDGEATLFVNQTIGWHTITPRNPNVYTPTKIRTLKLETLLGDRTADLVKVDTEGAELKILAGAPPDRVMAWLIEAHGGEPRKRELETELMEKGYETVWVTDTHIYAHVPTITEIR